MEDAMEKGIVVTPSSLVKTPQRNSHATPIRPTPVFGSANTNPGASPVVSEIIMRYQGSEVASRNCNQEGVIPVFYDDVNKTSKQSRFDAGTGPHAFSPVADVTNTNSSLNCASNDSRDHFLRRRMKLKQHRCTLSNPPKQLILPVGWNPSASVPGTGPYSNASANVLDSPLLLSIGQVEVSPTTGVQPVSRGWPISYNAPIRSLALESNGKQLYMSLAFIL